MRINRFDNYKVFNSDLIGNLLQKQQLDFKIVQS